MGQSNLLVGSSQHEQQMVNIKAEEFYKLVEFLRTTHTSLRSVYLKDRLLMAMTGKSRLVTYVFSG